MASIEIGGITMKKAGKGWGIGKLRVREDGEERIEELLSPTYAPPDADIAISMLVRRARASEPDLRHLDYLLLEALESRSGRFTAETLFQPGIVVRALREEQELSLRRLSRLSGMARATIRELERGSDPHASTLGYLLLALGAHP